MPPERRKAAVPHSERKPYVRTYRPFTMRLERPPSRTPSPTGFLSSLRKVYEPSVSDIPPPSLPTDVPAPHVSAIATPELPIASAAAADVQPPAHSTAASSSEEKLQAPPDKKFDPSVKVKIKRPKGGLGKQNQGGYKLSTVLEAHGWSGSHYTDVQNEVRALTVLKLDTDRSFKDQSSVKVQAFLREVISRFPGIEYYENGWPACDLAYQYLKNKPKVTV